MNSSVFHSATVDQIENDYFSFLIGFAGKEASRYKKLLMFLYMTPFHGGVLDENRETDGVDFRYRFINQLAVLNNEDKLYFLDLPCNMLEMMIALSVRCEEQIMGDPDIGDRTSIWFWGMIKNLKLYNMTDSQYRIGYIQNVMDNLRYRKFKPNGDGGLFTISRNDIDMREIEIWDQMSWFLNEIMK